jgi:hypothetical protein
MKETMQAESFLSNVMIELVASLLCIREVLG